jgi:hypothetical protein
MAMTTHDTNTEPDGLAALRRALRVAVIAHVGAMLVSLARRFFTRCDGLHPCCRQ